RSDHGGVSAGPSRLRPCAGEAALCHARPAAARRLPPVHAGTIRRRQDATPSHCVLWKPRTDPARTAAHVAAVRILAFSASDIRENVMVIGKVLRSFVLVATLGCDVALACSPALPSTIYVGNGPTCDVTNIADAISAVSCPNTVIVVSTANGATYTGQHLG